MKKYRITTRIHEGIRDIQGEAVTARFNEFGWDLSIEVGQVFYVETELPIEKLDEICAHHLVNHKLYNYFIEDVTEEGGLTDEDLDALQDEVDAEFEGTDDDSK